MESRHVCQTTSFVGVFISFSWPSYAPQEGEASEELKKQHAEHTHDDSVGSLSICADGDIHMLLVNDFMGECSTHSYCVPLPHTPGR